MSKGRTFRELPPLGLYVHLPWCVRKCPYCDFNSHEAPEEVPEAAYVDALLGDLADDMPLVWGRSLSSVFIGGGTPSLFSAEALDRLLSGVRALTALSPGTEITMEANPGTMDASRFSEYRAIGINRLSIGVQSLDDRALQSLGRIHDAKDARRAVDVARKAGFDNLNLDLMYGLPDQSLDAARDDLAAVIELEPTHLSCYELTLEPNTRFAAFPPDLPADDTRFDMQAAHFDALSAAGFERYEVSAFARDGQRCEHNLNYWAFGDYLGIGAGAHGKLSFADSGDIRRLSKQRHPKRYLEAANASARLAQERTLPLADTGLEFMMNALRLTDGVPSGWFEQRTGLSLAPWHEAIQRSVEDGLMQKDPQRLAATDRGLDLLNTLLERFMPEATGPVRPVFPLKPVT